MYADLEERKQKPDLKARLGTELLTRGTQGWGRGRGRVHSSSTSTDNPRKLTGGKRGRQEDDKWEHDLFSSQSNTPAIIPEDDLRNRLNNKAGGSSPMAIDGADLRDKLATKTSQQQRAVRRRVVLSVPTRVTDTLGAVRQVTKRPMSIVTKLAVGGQQQSMKSFLSNLGLEKYVASFQVEEVDMEALKHMKEEDLKEMGIPMGPRKKIILALNPV